MRYRCYMLIVPLVLLSKVTHSDDGPTGARHLSLKQAVAHALAHSPMLAAAGHQVDADTARLNGNPGFPNPALSVEVEDFLGSGVAHGVDGAQVTTALSQDVPLGGKVDARRRVNTAKQAVSIVERDIAEQLLMTDVSIAFLEVLAEQRRMVNADEMVALAQATLDAIALQVEAGRATGIEVDKAAIVLSLAKLDADRVTRDLVAAKQRLASACGESTPFFDDVLGTLDHIAPLPDMAALLKRVDNHPLLLVRTAELRQQQAMLALEKASRVPDLSLSVGYRWLNATSDSALVAGVAVPLPLADRNEGPIGAASHEVLKSQKQGNTERVALFQSITEIFQLLASEHNRASVLKKEIYPKALSTFEAVNEGYRIGRFGYLDLIDAQRTLFEIKEQTLEALVAYHRTAIRLNQTAALAMSPSRFESSAGKGDVAP